MKWKKWRSVIACLAAAVLLTTASGLAVFAVDPDETAPEYVWSYTVEYHMGGSVVSEQVLPGGRPVQVPNLSASGYTAWSDSEGRLADPAGMQIWQDQVFTAIFGPSITLTEPGGPVTPTDPVTSDDPATSDDPVTSDDPATSDDPVTSDDPAAPAVPTVTLKKSSTHEKYMNGGGDGLFHPAKTLTRAELAQMLYAVVEQRPQTGPTFSDVAWNAWYASAAQTVVALGLMDPYSDGTFRPDQVVTRAECAVALARLIPPDSLRKAYFPDVPESHWAYEEISRVGGYGLFVGDAQGNFNPDNELSRAEIVTVFNRLLGRAPDAGALAGANNLRIFPDVPTTHWAYSAVMEATTSHESAAGAGGQEIWTSIADEKTALADGFYCIDGWLYCVKNGVFLRGTAGQTYTDGVYTFDANGRYTTGNAQLDQQLNAVVRKYTNYPAADAVLSPLADGYYRIDGWLYCVKNGVFLRGTTDGVFTFDANGRYTTGNAELDQRLNAIVEKYTNSSMTRDQKLRALYNYVRDNFTYLSRPHVSKGQTGWEPEYALFFLQKGKGNCFSFSATYCLLCRELGLPAYTVVGGLGSSASPHGWVEIVLDGTRYMFDTQLEWRYLHDYGRSGYNLFKMIPGKTPFIYTW